MIRTRERGITLIALIITIIILIILAAISLFASFGGNGIVDKADEAALAVEYRTVRDFVISEKICKSVGYKGES